MEEDGDGEDLTPFWLQSTTNVRRTDRLSHRVSSLFFSSGLVVLLLLVTAVSFLVFVVPSTLTFSAQIFRPNNVKKSWDSLNTVLVLVAVVFGFLSRIKNEDRYSYYDEFQASPNKQNEPQKSNPSISNQSYDYGTSEERKSSSISSSVQWYEYSDYYHNKLEHRDSILERNRNSYPDLRDLSSKYVDYQRRFYDDIHVEMGRVSDLGHLHRRHRSLEEVHTLRAEPQTKPFFIDTLVSRSKEATGLTPLSPPPPSPPAQPAALPEEYEEKPKKSTYENVARRKERSRRKVKKEFETMNPITELIPAVSLPSPPPPADLGELLDKPNCIYESGGSSMERSNWKLNKDVEPTNPITTPPPPPQEKNSKSERKRGGATGSATKDFLNSLYHKKKKKKQRQKSVDNVYSLLPQAEAPSSFQLPPASPPHPAPLPPPPSVFQNLFSSKKHKRKRTITVSAAPPSPPPPPSHTAVREPEPTSEIVSWSTHNPAETTKTNSLEKFEELPNSGAASPVSRIPPPPPLPPPAFFKNPTWKFVVQGDYVRIDSTTTSRSGSPDLYDVESDTTPSGVEGGGAPPFHPAPLFCPSPDVNTKAESFITNFRAKLKLEKIHSMKKRDLGLSSLGPGSGPNQT